ncbi:MAG: low-complexity protein [Gammaproteobacteria bacterium]|nr:low-complexity protein [Gammaproteobacteria bacterium]
MSKLKIAIGAAVVTGLGIAGVANAEDNDKLFSMDELSSGYLTAGAHEGSCGEGKCGDNKKDDDDKKDGEGACGGDKAS